MFGRVVSNFRKKRKSLLKNSVSSPEIKIDLGRKFATKFSSDESLSATLSVIDKECADKPVEGANKSPSDNSTVYNLQLLTMAIFGLFAVLSGQRCSEMTVVYDDIQAVTRLLQEKEKVISSYHSPTT